MEDIRDQIEKAAQPERGIWLVMIGGEIRFGATAGSLCLLPDIITGRPRGIARHQGPDAFRIHQVPAAVDIPAVA